MSSFYDVIKLSMKIDSQVASANNSQPQKNPRKANQLYTQRYPEFTTH